MTLKEVIVSEAHSVFLNGDDFAESISIEDVPETPAICDWSVQPEGANLYGDIGDGRGINAVHANITIGEGVIPLPEVGQEITVNDMDWIVRSADAASGLLNLKLFRNAG